MKTKDKEQRRVMILLGAIVFFIDRYHILINFLHPFDSSDATGTQ
ncbi:hypothetical protein ABE921_03205 [Enterococcus gallinarum]